MSETNVPAAEAAVATPSTDDERMSYEFAFHVLPTVAEGEVATVYSDLKQLIEKHGGELFDEEAPKRFDLAYEIVKHLEGKNRKFTSAYFGWVRFKLDSEELEKLAAMIDNDRNLLRHLIIRLTKVEEEHPFRFHEGLETAKVTNITEPESAPVEAPVTHHEENRVEEEKVDVDEDKLDEALNKEEV